MQTLTDSMVAMQQAITLIRHHLTFIFSLARRGTLPEFILQMKMMSFFFIWEEAFFINFQALQNW